MNVLKRSLTTVAAVAGLAASLAMPLPASALEPGYRAVDAAHTLVIDTTKGQIIVEMYPEMAPNHVERLVTLTRQGFYNGSPFHRVIEGFMAQTGGVDGQHSNLSTLNAEFLVRHDATFPFHVVKTTSGAQYGFVGAMPVQSQVPELAAITRDGKVEAWGIYCQGVLGMARTNDPNSADSGFFLTRGPSSFLERRYTAFGAVVSGLDVVRKIKLGEPPVDPDQMTRVRLLSDIPEGERPSVEVMDTGSEAFRTLVDAKRRERGASFSVCDIALPTKVTQPTSSVAAQ